MGRRAKSVTIDSAEFDKAMQSYIATSKRTTKELLNEQGKIIIVEAAKITPPNKGAKWNKKGGEIAVTNDINKILIGLAPGLYEQFVEIFGGSINRRELRRKDGTVYVSDNDVAVSNLAQWHRSQRTRNGRVTSAGQTGDRNIGRSKSYNRGVTTEAKKTAYIKKAVKMVGKQAAGWKAAAVKLGAKLPAWITRHERAGYINYKQQGSRGVLELANAGVYARARGSIERRLKAVLAKRTGAITRRVQYYLKQNAKASGFGVR
jgi:hypothetical protein